MLLQIDDFSRYLFEVKKSSSNTIEAYLRDIKLFNKYLETKNIFSLNEINEINIYQYIEFLNGFSRASSTINRNIVAIKSYFTFEYLRGKIIKNPCENIKVSSKEKGISGALTKEEISRLLSAPDISNYKGIRDYAMLELLYATGIRVSELVDLNLENINLSSGYIILTNDLDRLVPVHTQAIKAVNSYIQNARQYLNTEKINALFLNLNGKRITRQGFSKILKKYAIKSNIDKDVNPYTIRHSFAIHLIQNGASIKDVSILLGHSRISTTNIYTDFASNNVKNTYSKYHPKSIK